MPTPSASISDLSPLLWLAGLFILGFGVAYLLTGSVLAPVLGHILMHIGGVVHGT